MCDLLFSAAILVYRVFRNETKRNVKLLHGIIHLLALIISTVGESKIKIKKSLTDACES